MKSDGPLKITSPSPLDQVRTARLSPTTSKSYSSTAPLKTPDLRTPDEYWICCPCGTILLFADPDWALKRAPWLDPWALLAVYCCERYAICKWNLLIRSQNPFIIPKICLFTEIEISPLFLCWLLPSICSPSSSLTSQPNKIFPTSLFAWISISQPWWSNIF